MRFAPFCSLALAVAVAACGQVETPPTLSEADATPADGEAQLVPASASDATGRSLDELPRHILIEEDHLHAEVTIDEAAFSKAPAIAMDIVDQAEILIDALSYDAREYKKADPEFFRAYRLVIDWKVVAEAGDLMSLEGFVYTDTGGAHGNYYTDARIYNSLLGLRLAFGDLFLDPEMAVQLQLDAVHQGIVAEKKKRFEQGGDADGFKAEAMELVPAEAVLQGEISLAPSDQPDRIGGYVLHFAPYDIGSYAEGAYEIVVPQTVFHDALKPEYQRWFAGVPNMPDPEE